MKMKVWSACFALSISALLASCGGSASNDFRPGPIPVVPDPTPAPPPADPHPTNPVNACGATTAVKMSCPPTASSS